VNWGKKTDRRRSHFKPPVLGQFHLAGGSAALATVAFAHWRRPRWPRSPVGPQSHQQGQLPQSIPDLPSPISHLRALCASVVDHPRWMSPCGM